MKLRQIAVVAGAVADISRDARRALLELQRARHGSVSPSVGLGLLVAGIAIGAYIVRPETRAALAHWLAPDAGAAQA